jgi:hypothetical protein
MNVPKRYIPTSVEKFIKEPHDRRHLRLDRNLSGDLVARGLL